ncbi:MAG: hypothetical protein ACLQIB_55050 [Isosphaeraceae bacterium]
MDRSTFESADLIIDEIAPTLDELLDSDQFSAVRVALARLSETVGPRYSVGDMHVVPHDRCPNCYGLRDFKLKNPSCSECGATMGREVKLLLDTDVCPFCEEGEVSLTVPVCAKCRQRIDPAIVVWG